VPKGLRYSGFYQQMLIKGVKVVLFEMRDVLNIRPVDPVFV